MGNITKIEWCDATWNPVNGCAPVSPGCANCYASALSVRWGKGKYGATRERTLASAATLRLPYRLDNGAGMDRKRRVFTASLSDVFDPVWPVEGHVHLLANLAQCTNCNFILVTKRPQLWRWNTERVANLRTWEMEEMSERDVHVTREMALTARSFARVWLTGWNPPNVCVMASVENQAYADRRIPDLLHIPARWHGLSLEPLLGEVNLNFRDQCGRPMPRNINGCWNPQNGDDDCDGSRTTKSKIDWLVIGGESGPKARPCNIDWIRSLVGQGQEAGVAVFVKQLGANPIGYNLNIVRIVAAGIDPLMPSPIKLAHKKGGDQAEWPADLRVREWPKCL